MKKTILLVLLTFSINIFAQSFINEELDGYYDDINKTLKIKFNDYSFDGKVENIKYNYSDCLFVKGAENHLLICFTSPNSKMSTGLYKLTVVNGDYEKVKKAILKNRLKPQAIVYEYDLTKGLTDKKLNTNWDNVEYLKKKEEKKLAKENAKKELTNKYFTLSNIEKYEGTYKVTIGKTGSSSFIGLNQKGKLYITKEGITFKSEIPSIDLLRGNHFVQDTPYQVKKVVFIVN